MHPSARDFVITSARNHAQDRYLSALLAPRAVRDDLLTLAAFAGEIERIPALVSEPQLGEIRLQWWRDVLVPPADDQGKAHNTAATGNPLADEMLSLMSRHNLDGGDVDRMISGRVYDLYAEPVRSHNELSTYLDDCEGTYFRLAAHICGQSNIRTEQPKKLADATGQAYGAVRLLQRLPALIAKGRFPLYVDPAHAPALDAIDLSSPEHLAVAQHGVDNLVAGARAALASATPIWQQTSPQARLPNLLFALVEPYLRVHERNRAASCRQPIDLLPITRVWRLWTARKFGWLAAAR